MLNILFILGLLSLILFVVSACKLRRGKSQVELIYHWAFPFGAFVWEDLMIFSLFNLLSIIGVLLIRDLRVGALIFLVFWIVRSAGEVVYWFLQQFNQPTVYPHNLYMGFSRIRKLVGEISDQQCFILLQVFCEGLLAIFLTLLLLLLINWQSINGRF